MKYSPAKLVNESTEFPNKVDICLSASFPVPPYYQTFIDIDFKFIAGFVPISIGEMQTLFTIQYEILTSCNIVVCTSI